MAYSTIDEYIKDFLQDEQKILQTIRRTIKKAVPQATEKISYGIPAFYINGKYLIYFAGYRQHVSIYPVSAGNGPFAKDIAPYLSGKGTAKFPLDKPIPYALIRRVALYRAKQSGQN